MAIDRAALREKLAGRTAQSYAAKDEAGGFRTYLRPTNGRPVFRKFAEGQIMFDIIPFPITADFMMDPDHPGKPRYVAGDWTYYLEIFSHMNIGPNDWNVCCPQKNFGLPCPICEEYARLQAAGADWDTVLKPLKLNRRCVYNIWMHDAPSLKEEAKGVQLLEIAHFSLEANILPLTRDPRTGVICTFSSPDVDGRTIYFERKGTKVDNTRYSGFQLLPRTEAIPDAILDQAVPLNEAIEVLDYEQLSALFKGGVGPGDREAQPAADRATRRPPMSQVPQNAPVETQPEPEPEPVAAPPRRPAPQAATTTPPPVTPARRPAPQAAPAAAPAATPPAAPAASADGAKACPHGMVFGEDTDKIEGCNGCELYDECGAAFDATH